MEMERITHQRNTDALRGIDDLDHLRVWLENNNGVHWSYFEKACERAYELGSDAQAARIERLEKALQELTEASTKAVSYIGRLEKALRDLYVQDWGAANDFIKSGWDNAEDYADWCMKKLDK